MEEPFFKFIALKEAVGFIESLSLEVQRKIYYNIDKVAGGVRDSELFKKLDGSEIWEFRTLYQGKSYRLFAFWDTETEAFVIATHGILKKTQKTPKKEIAKAEAIREIYFNAKNARP